MTHMPPDDSPHGDGDRELRALTQLFDAVAPNGRAEAEDELLDAGVDPQQVGQQCARLAQRALAGSTRKHPTDEGPHTNPAHLPPPRVRPRPLWAIAAVALLALAGLTLLRLSARHPIEPPAPSASLTSRPSQEGAAPPRRSLQEPSGTVAGTGRLAAGAPEQPPPAVEQYGRAAPAENPPSATLSADVPRSSATVSSAAVWIDAMASAARVFRDTTQRLQMTVYQPQGEETTHLELQTKLFDDGAFKAVVRFEPSPEREVTALLLDWAGDTAGDATSGAPLNAWAFVPSLRRVRRLTPPSCAINSDISCLDLLIPGEFLPWAAANWDIVTITPYPGAALTFDLLPRVDTSVSLPPGYSKLRISVRPDATLRSVFFTNYLNSEVKLLLVDDFRRINDIPVPYRLEMANQQAGTRTVLTMLDFRHDDNLSGDLFTIAHIIGEWR